VDNNLHNFRQSNQFKIINGSENKLYNEYVNLKNEQIRSSLKKTKIAHIFNIRSINLIEKIKYEKEKNDHQVKLRLKYTPKEIKRNMTDKS
jgi:hypothetical protein